MGDVRVEHFEVPKVNLGSLYYGADAPSPGHYVRLMEGRTLWMSDTYMEHRTNINAKLHARGRVLVVGLGLGMVATEIAAKKTVKKVVVVERSPDVVQAVATQLSKNLPRTHTRKFDWQVGDIWTWRPAAGQTFNYIYFDIWPDMCTDYLVEMRKLEKLFTPYLDKSDSAGIEFWAKPDLQYRKRRGQ